MPTLEKKPFGVKKTSVEDKKPSDEGKAVGGITGSGWDKVAHKKIINDEAQKGNYYTVILKDGESAVVQFLDDEPFCFEGHQSKRFHWNVKACQLIKQKYCLMCDAGMKLVWKAAFRVLDFRGEWDKDKKKFKYDKPVERILLASLSVATQIKGFKDKYGRELTQMVLEMTRTGSGAKDTTYNFERAINPKTDEPRKPVVHETKLEHPRVMIKPPKDNELIALGVSGGKMSDEETPDDGDSLPF